MKKAVLFLALLAPGLGWGQQSGPGDDAPAGTVLTSANFPTERVQKPTAADLYCSGFVGKPISSKDRFVAGGLDSPYSARFFNSDSIFLNGKGYETGQEYTVVRELRDSNRYELFKGQWAALKASGQPYEELARVKIIDTRNKMAVAIVEFSCDAIVTGDYVLPFVEKETTAFHPPMRFDRFAPANGQVSGRILLAKDFDSELGTGGKVYVNVGSSQGLKVGDYLRAVRTYQSDARDPVTSLSYKANANEETQTKQAAVDPGFLDKTGGPVINTANMPRRAVAEIIVIGTTPATATGMIVFSMEPVHVGDGVELDPQ